MILKDQIWVIEAHIQYVGFIIAVAMINVEIVGHDRAYLLLELCSSHTLIIGNLIPFTYNNPSPIKGHLRIQ